MSIQNNYDLKLLGNLIVDEVYCLPHWAQQGTSNLFNSHYTSIGGIGNIIRSIKENINILIEYKIGNDNDGKLITDFLKDHNTISYPHFSIKPTSKALILSNLVSNERTSFVNWGCGTEIFIPTAHSAQWTHISYLDIIPSFDLKYLRDYTQILSADLCLSNPSQETIQLVLNQLQYLDYLFISEAELPFLISKCSIDQLITQYHLKCLIFHTRHKTQILNHTNSEVIGKHTTVENINVLGAGDAYCANFILYLLNHKSEKDAALWAHQQATNFISNQSITLG